MKETETPVENAVWVQRTYPILRKKWQRIEDLTLFASIPLAALTTWAVWCCDPARTPTLFVGFVSFAMWVAWCHVIVSKLIPGRFNRATTIGFGIFGLIFFCYFVAIIGGVYDGQRTDNLRGPEHYENSHEAR